MEENHLGRILLDVAFEVHRTLGPGLLESVYEVVLAHEFRQKGIEVERQVPVSVKYAGLRFEEGFRADLIIQNKLIVELKCVEKVSNAHRKQLLTYLRLTGLKLGFILNFSAAVMKDGVIRVVNGLDDTQAVAPLR
jgi:GxxExxY protein